mmetsp:Transcript_24814/g.72693  ORF Transcript_24814/g.72693 Transcript_24814/m.72693 type:complete len:316 (-) Transcript_24814:667-1614(-)
MPKAETMPSPKRYELSGGSSFFIQPSLRLEPSSDVHVRTVLQIRLGILLVSEECAVRPPITLGNLVPLQDERFIQLPHPSEGYRKQPHCFLDDSIQIGAVLVYYILCQFDAVLCSHLFLLRHQLIPAIRVHPDQEHCINQRVRGRLGPRKDEQKGVVDDLLARQCRGAILLIRGKDHGAHGRPVGTLGFQLVYPFLDLSVQVGLRLKRGVSPYEPHRPGDQEQKVIRHPLHPRRDGRSEGRNIVVALEVQADDLSPGDVDREALQHVLHHDRLGGEHLGDGPLRAPLEGRHTPRDALGRQGLSHQPLEEVVLLRV